MIHGRTLLDHHLACLRVHRRTRRQIENDIKPLFAEGPIIAIVQYGAKFSSHHKPVKSDPQQVGRLLPYRVAAKSLQISWDHEAWRLSDESPLRRAVLRLFRRLQTH